jgi:uncharacterized membrane protein
MTSAEQRSAGGTAQRRSWERQWRWLLALLAIFAVGIVIRGYQLAARSLWFDEGFTWRLIQFPYAEMLERTTRDNHPPLYFILLKAWCDAFGTSVFALRALSVLLGGLAIVGMYLFASEAFGSPPTKNGETGGTEHRGQSVGLLVAALVALSAFQVRWSWDARMYSLGAALAAFSSWAMFRALHAQHHPWRSWLLYGLLALLFAYTHYYAIFSLCAQALFVLGYCLIQARGNLVVLLKSVPFRGALLAGVVVAVGWAPWVPVFLRQRAQVQADFWARPVNAWDVPNACYEMMFLDPEEAVWSGTRAALAAALCSGALLALLWKARAAEWYVFVAAVVPFVLSVLVSVLGTNVFYLRYFVFAHLFLLTTIAVLIWRIPFPRGRCLACAVVLAGFLAVYLWFWTRLDIDHKPGARAAAQFVADNGKPEDPVIVTTPWIYLPILAYAEDQAHWKVFSTGRPVVHYLGQAVLTPDDLITEGQLNAISSRRVWVVDVAKKRPLPHTIPIPSGWVKKGEEHFPEVFHQQGEIVVKEYENRRGH